jgi:hypothetical protein
MIIYHIFGKKEIENVLGKAGSEGRGRGNKHGISIDYDANGGDFSWLQRRRGGAK